ncbi:prephenate dehydratase domain-containing protein [Sandaracinobacteroides saxicola]|uniref:prephenate dehydratase n=1 Tax=Sandaracinobacteroides saxicola TaxID=2759707 RepID=A0A7G5IKZ7_9SPHN|nr:prephenate dehydratase domain-containing protein [Sandaracinobacteroides saxicola]QMW24039.1 prephenate dehydratase [Sandaracinobacteroides saxicola]
MSSYPAPARALVDAMTAAAAAEPARAVAFQGAPGAYSHQAVREALPDALPLPCFSFEEAVDAVIEGRAARAMLPVENNLHGRVADVHVLLPESGLAVVGEHSVKVEHCLLGLPGTTIAGIRTAMSHPQALGQTRKTCKRLGLRQQSAADTAASAAAIVEAGDPTVAAIASRLAAELYGCTILLENIQDQDSNTTRFLLLQPTAVEPAADAPVKTMLVFEVKHIPAALFKALGGFATNGVNISRLESHLVGNFSGAAFLLDIEGHPRDPAVARALEELAFHSKWVRLLGSWALKG